jgi:hypothetical protein
MTKAELAQTTNRASVAMLALGAVCVVRLMTLALMQIQIGLIERMQRHEVVSQDEIGVHAERVRILAELGLVAGIGAGVLFLYWLYSAHARAIDFGRKGRPLPTPFGAVASFFIPFVNLVRPFSQMHDLLWASDPRDLELPLKIRMRAAPTYREPAFEVVPVVWKRPRVFVGAWWAGYQMMGLISLSAVFYGAVHSRGDLATWISTSRVQMVHDVAMVIGGALCIGVMRGITRCQVERFRRLRLLARKDHDEGQYLGASEMA